MLTTYWYLLLYPRKKKTFLLLYLLLNFQIVLLLRYLFSRWSVTAQGQQNKLVIICIIDCYRKKYSTVYDIMLKKKMTTIDERVWSSWLTDKKLLRMFYNLRTKYKCTALKSFIRYVRVLKFFAYSNLRKQSLLCKKKKAFEMNERKLLFLITVFIVTVLVVVCWRNTDEYIWHMIIQMFEYDVNSNTNNFWQTLQTIINF